MYFCLRGTIYLKKYAGMNLKINSREREKWEKHKPMENKQHATKTNKKRVSEGIKEEVRKYLKTNENENTFFQKFMSCNKSSSKEGSL